MKITDKFGYETEITDDGTILLKFDGVVILEVKRSPYSLKEYIDKIFKKYYNSDIKEHHYKLELIMKWIDR